MSLNDIPFAKSSSGIKLIVLRLLTICDLGFLTTEALNV